MATYTTTDLITSIQNRGMLPDASSGSLSTATLLNFATEELHLTVVPMILAAREKYYETNIDTPIIAGQSAYPLPTRAIGGVLSTVQYLFSNGPGINILQQIDPNEINTTQQMPYPAYYYFQNNNLILYPTPSSTTGNLRMRYYQRPSRLEQTINCAQVQSVNTGTNTVTVASIPSAWVTGVVLDFIPAKIPYTPYSLDQTATVSGTSLTFISLPSNVAIGDWLALSEYTPIPEVPFEFFPLLAQATVCKALEAIGDQQNMQLAAQKLQSYQAAAMKLLIPRDQNGTKKVVSNWRRW